MMRELCLRNGVALPSGDDTLDPVAMRVFVIRHELTGTLLEDVAAQMWQNHAEITFTEDITELETAARVLLILSAGILASPTLETLEAVLRADAASGNDRLVCVYSEAAGWSFGCAAQREAPQQVRPNNNLALTCTELLSLTLITGAASVE